MHIAAPPIPAPLALPAGILVALVVPAVAHGAAWARPVPGAVAHAFSYARADPFAAGAHRGLDLAAPPGTKVRAACGGRVLHAGPVAGFASVVSIRCGTRRVSHLPLAGVMVPVGATVRAGTPIGSVARGHGGLHLGVRREADRFGYEDPAALLPTVPPSLPVVAARPARPAPRTARPVVGPARGRAAGAARPDPLLEPQGGLLPVGAPAPWPVWAGLGLMLVGATGSGSAVALRRRRHRRDRRLARHASKPRGSPG